MNIKNNKRSQNTDEAIIRAAFEAMLLGGKQISRITVREICEKAGINRSTFYAHYSDVFDLFEKVEQQMAEMCKERLLGRAHMGFRAMMESVFEFIMEYKDFYQIYFSEINQVTHLMQLMTAPFHDAIDEISSKDMGHGVENESAYHFYFFTAGISAVIACWLGRNCKESPHELFDIIQREYGGGSLFLAWREE